MIIKYHEWKEAVYIMMAVAGAFFLVFAIMSIQAGHGGPISSSGFISGLILLLAGVVCELFALVTYIIRDDPDVWR